VHLSATGTRDVHRLLRSLVGRRYRAGDRVMITLTTPGYLAERVEIRAYPRSRSCANTDTVSPQWDDPAVALGGACQRLRHASMMRAT
jgi:hypothetical protein